MAFCVKVISLTNLFFLLQVVLSACSSYFQSLFVDHPSRHPIVILKDVRFSELRTLVEFMYKGEVNVEYCQLSALLKTARVSKSKNISDKVTLSLLVCRSGGNDARIQPPEEEQTEPKELVNRRPPPPAPAPPPVPASQEEENSCPGVLTSVPPPHLGTSDCGASDMSMHSNSVLNVAATSVVNPPPPSQLQLHQAVSALATSLSSSSAASSCSNRLPSPMNCDPVPVPGPSNMPPVQQVPLVSTSNVL
nr:unnamed protein product [Callosobruchus analis]